MQKQSVNECLCFNRIAETPYGHYRAVSRLKLSAGLVFWCHDLSGTGKQGRDRAGLWGWKHGERRTDDTSPVLAARHPLAEGA
jgi:hypothetical protein